MSKGLSETDRGAAIPPVDEGGFNPCCELRAFGERACAAVSPRGIAETSQRSRWGLGWLFFDGLQRLCRREVLQEQITTGVISLHRLVELNCYEGVGTPPTWGHPARDDRGTRPLPGLPHLTTAAP